MSELVRDENGRWVTYTPPDAMRDYRERVAREHATAYSAADRERLREADHARDRQAEESRREALALQMAGADYLRAKLAPTSTQTPNGPRS